MPLKDANSYVVNSPTVADFQSDIIEHESEKIYEESAPEAHVNGYQRTNACKP